MSLGRFIDRSIKAEVTRQMNNKIDLFAKAQGSNDLTGPAEVTRLNSDGTVNVNFKGREVRNVAPGAKPVGVGTQAILQSGKKLTH